MQFSHAMVPQKDCLSTVNLTSIFAGSRAALWTVLWQKLMYICDRASMSSTGIPGNLDGLFCLLRSLI